MESHEEDGVEVLLMGSGAHSFNRIFETVWDPKTKVFNDEINTLKVLIHHTSTKNKKQWVVNVRPQLELIQDGLGIPFEIEYIELPYYKSDKKSSK